MPIRRTWRHHYQGEHWQAIRRRIHERAGGKCENCAKPDRASILVTRGGYWRDTSGAKPVWRGDNGDQARPPHAWVQYTIRVVLMVAHLDHDPENNSEANLRLLCQHCHLKHDYWFHRATARRNLAAASGQAWLEGVE